MILGSLAIGAFSHIAWDSFTHEHGWAVAQIPSLATPLMSFRGHDLRIFKVLQYGSTAIGLALLAYWYGSWFKISPETIDAAESTLSHRARLALIATLAALPCGFGLVSAIRASSEGFYRMTGHFVVATISASCLLALGYGLLFGLLARRTRSWSNLQARP